MHNFHPECGFSFSRVGEWDQRTKGAPYPRKSLTVRSARTFPTPLFLLTSGSVRSYLSCVVPVISVCARSLRSSDLSRVYTDSCTPGTFVALHSPDTPRRPPLTIYPVSTGSVPPSSVIMSRLASLLTDTPLVSPRDHVLYSPPHSGVGGESLR